MRHISAHASLEIPITRVTSFHFETGAQSSADYPRGGLPEVAFLGRSNVGKSSLINTLTGRDMARVSKTPGRTQQANFYRVNESFLFVDLPGYGYAKAPIAVRRELARVIEDYLSARRPTALVVQIVDSRHEPSELDLEMNKWMVGQGLPIRVVCNKIDKVSRRDHRASLQRAQSILSQQGVIPFSSQTGEGKRELWQVIDNQIASLKSQTPVTPTGGQPT